MVDADFSVATKRGVRLRPMNAFTICMSERALDPSTAHRAARARTAFGRGWIEHSGGERQILGTWGDISIFACGRIRLDGRPLKSRDDAARQLADAWRRYGRDVVNRLSGEFLVAFADEAGKWLACVDRFSCFRVYYSGGKGCAVFGTTPIGVADAVGRTPELDPRAVLAYAYFHIIPAPLSICAGVRRLDLGEYLAGDGNGSWGVHLNWRPKFAETGHFDFGAERDRFMQALRAGVSECTDGLTADDVGCFLSGGTDSSTIAGLVTERFGSGARTFSIGFGVHGYDETRYSRMAARHFGTRHTEYYLEPAEVERTLPAVATAFEQPFGNSSALPTLVCARLAAEAQVRRMLGGDGGDELYGGNLRYAKQWLFSAWSEVPSPVRSGLLEPLLFGPLKSSEISLLRKARSYVEQACVPLPDRLQKKHNLLEHFGRGNVFTGAVLSQARAFEPVTYAQEVWARCNAASEINRHLAFDFKFTLFDSDLPKVMGMCEVAGVEAAFPMLTHAVTDHSLALPPDQKLRRMQLRYFFKNALRGFLPDEILRKPKHGFGMPFGAWAVTHPGLTAVVDDALAGLARRGVLKPGFSGELRTAMESGYAGYYGTMVWILTVLELWLREHLPDARCA